MPANNNVVMLLVDFGCSYSVELACKVIMIFQKQKMNSGSPLEVYRQVALLRQDKTALHAQHVTFLPGNEYVLAYVRYNPDNSESAEPLLIAINLGPDDAAGVGTNEVVILGVQYKWGLLVLDSRTGLVSDTSEAPVVMRLTDIRLEKGQAVILQLSVADKDEL